MLRLVLFTLALLQPCIAWGQLNFPALATGHIDYKVKATAYNVPRKGLTRAGLTNQFFTSPTGKFVAQANRTYPSGTLGVSNAQAFGRIGFDQNTTVRTGNALTRSLIPFVRAPGTTYDKMRTYVWMNAKAVSGTGGCNSFDLNVEAVSGRLRMVWSNHTPGQNGLFVTVYIAGRQVLQQQTSNFQLAFLENAPLNDVTISAINQAGGACSQTVNASSGEVTAYIDGVNNPPTLPGGTPFPKPSDWPSDIPWYNPTKFDTFNPTDWPNVPTGDPSTWPAVPDEGTEEN